MANLSLRIPDDLLSRFDCWAGDKGGRAPALRRLMTGAAGAGPTSTSPAPTRSSKLTVRLTSADRDALANAAQDMGMTPNAWAAALIRFRLTGVPTFGPPDEVALVAIQAEYRRIGVNVNQLARALNTAVLDGRALELELAFLGDLRTELRGHLSTLRAAFEGARAYWATDW